MTDVIGIGHNLGVDQIPEQLALDHAALLDDAQDLLGFAGELPGSVESSLDVSAIASFVVKLRDLAARAEAQRVAAKEPYLRGGDAVQAFFMKRLIDPLKSEQKKQSARIDVFKQRQLAEERARRAAEAAEARRQQQEAQRLREEAEAAARRARSPETKEQRRDEARAAAAESDIADANAETAILSTMAKASAIVGERFEGDRSGKVSMRQVPVAYIDDIAKLDLELLRPFFKEEHLLLALKAWARSTSYMQEMPGATVGMRDATVVR